MRSIGCVRALDKLNRLVIPVEVVRSFELKNASVEVYVDTEAIILKKYVPGCIFCGGMDGLKPIKRKQVCDKCRIEARKGLGVT